ncbi:ribonuclease J [Candidatus Pacearchaeota archaeon CG10_big_fil_rev_8_21_14_0_10_34_12]|nr:MAG: ribonuclease J [Candidatus Pacearchaeota archaeon CG10_big_fil_rev_8_21_14_0_10_34_12]
MEIYTIGGYSEVGKNMTVVKTGEDAFIFDCGLYMPAVVELQGEEKKDLSEKKMRSKGAIPNDVLLDKLGIRNQVRAILPTHAHLDHIGAIPFLAHRYNAPVISSPFTISVLKKILDDDKKSINNKIISADLNSTQMIKVKNRSYRVEFINMTHSTPHDTMIALHTPEGIVLYGNDFKLDNTPVIGSPPNYKALQRISKQGVKVMISDSLYINSPGKTPSEKVARSMVEEVLLTVRNEKAAVFVTTFSSHIARLKSIVEFGKKLNREIIFVGRSLNRYVAAANESKLVPFKKDIRLTTYKRQVASMLKKVHSNRERYLVVCTGHQGEPGSVLERLSRKKLSFDFKKGDNLVFSSKTIPDPTNILNKEAMDKRLLKSGVRIFDNVHVSGHGSKEDIRDLIEIVNPENIIPSHAPTERVRPMIELSREEGYSKNQVHLMSDGQKLVLK